MELVTLKEIAERTGHKYDTLRKWSSRYPGFPPSIKGAVWNYDQVVNWISHHEETRKNGGSQYHKDPSTRAKLGHKFRRIRNLNKCSDCARSFYYNEEIWELRNDGELEILCAECYGEWIKGSSD